MQCGVHSGLFSANIGQGRTSAGAASTVLRLLGVAASRSSQAAEDTGAPCKESLGTSWSGSLRGVSEPPYWGWRPA